MAIKSFDEDQLKAKLATLKVDFDLAVAKGIAAGGGNQDYWSLLFKAKHRWDAWLFDALCSGLKELSLIFIEPRRNFPPFVPPRVLLSVLCNVRAGLCMFEAVLW